MSDATGDARPDARQLDGSVRFCEECGRRPPDHDSACTCSAVRLVRQEHANGCGIAVLAMITGRTYQDVLDGLRGQWPGKHDPEEGMHNESLEWYLALRGYVWRTFYVGWNIEPWPPAPFAPIHFAQVRQPSGSTHYVVVCDDGTVLDPLTDEPGTLADWEKVNNITGLWSW